MAYPKPYAKGRGTNLYHKTVQHYAMLYLLPDRPQNKAQALLNSDELLIWFSSQWGVPLNCASHSRYECHIVQGSCLGFYVRYIQPNDGKNQFLGCSTDKTAQHTAQHSTAHHSSAQNKPAKLTFLGRSRRCVGGSCFGRLQVGHDDGV